jgi:hypothetical protein
MALVPALLVERVALVQVPGALRLEIGVAGVVLAAVAAIAIADAAIERAGRRQIEVAVTAAEGQNSGPLQRHAFPPLLLVIEPGIARAPAIVHPNGDDSRGCVTCAAMIAACAAQRG